MSSADNRVKVEQIIGECFVKAAHVILGARTIHSTRRPARPTPKSWVRNPYDCRQTDHRPLLRLLSPPPPPPPRSLSAARAPRTSPLSVDLMRMQFNLDIEEVEAASRELEPWRRNFSQPLVLEVLAMPVTSDYGHRLPLTAPLSA